MRSTKQFAFALLALSACCPPGQNSSYSSAELDRLNDRLSPVAMRVQGAATELCYEMGQTQDCTVNIVLDPRERGLNAHADGRNIVINPAMVEFARNDTQLAFVLAHESAHQLLGHVAARKHAMLLIDTTRGNTPHYSPSLESQADYVGLYALARAGYPIDGATNFWGQLAQAQPRAAYVTQTHPSYATRSAAMWRAVAEIHAKQHKHAALVPNLNPKGI